MAIKSRADFNNVWKLLNKVIHEEGDSRLTAIFNNYSNKKEYICRKFGIISLPDIERFRRQIQDKKNFRSP